MATNKYNEISIWAIFVFSVFVLLQGFLSAYYNGDFLSFYGGVHIFWLMSFLFLVVISVRVDLKVIIFLGFTYMAFCYYANFQFYAQIFGNSLGINPMDALFYHELALNTSTMPLVDAFEYISFHGDMGELGFTSYTMLLYKLPGDPIVNMKISNLFMHCGTAYLLGKISNWIFSQEKTRRLVVGFFIFNPAGVYFGASGLKEPTFLFFVTVALYFIVISLHTRKPGAIVMAIVFSFCTSFFRVPFSVIFVTGFLCSLYFMSTGNLKVALRFILPVVFVSLLLVIFVTLSAEFTKLMNYDLNSIQTDRLGTESVGLVQYAALVLSGFIGPAPSFDYSLTFSDYPLQTTQNFVKVVMSTYFILGSWIIITNRMVALYFLPVIYFSNTIMLVLSAATFDFRFVYPLLSVFYLIVGVGIERGFFRINIISLFTAVTSFFFVGLYNLR